MSENRVVVGVFAEYAFAEQALTELQHNGFRNDQIGFLFRHGQGMPTEKLEEPGVQSELDKGAAAGLVTGSVIGGLVGAAAALFIPGFGPAIAGGILTSTFSGLLAGAIAGGLIGAFVHIGIPEDLAHYYEQELYQGRTIVIVQADERPIDAYNILKRNRGYDAAAQEQASQEQHGHDPEATIKLDEAP
jgi:hypothetical protein